MKLKYTPYVVKVAYFAVDKEDDFDKVTEFLQDNSISYSYRELCNGEGVYVEFEKAELDEFDILGLGDISELDAVIIQVWL